MECELITFDLNFVNYILKETTTLEKYKPVVFEKFNISNLTDDELKKSLIDVSFYFERFETNVITQTPSMTILDLVASVGGLLGKIYYIFHISMKLL